MPELAIIFVVVGQVAVQAAAIFGLAYAGARLAIRHERRASSTQ
jgi:hypothetical protein